jgi:hypothetical protein
MGKALRSWSHPTRYYNNHLYNASNGGAHDFDVATLFNDDANRVISVGFA